MRRQLQRQRRMMALVAVCAAAPGRGGMGREEVGGGDGGVRHGGECEGFSCGTMGLMGALWVNEKGRMARVR